MEEIIKITEQKLDSSISLLHERLSSIIATGAHPSILKNIKVIYYDELTPLSQVASIKVVDATMLVVQAFDKSMNKEIITSIHKADLGLNLADEGETIRIMISPMTTEKRLIFAKEAKLIGEEFRIAIRNIRTDSNKKIKAGALSENEENISEEKIQNLVNKANKKIEEIVKLKVKSLISI